jgi:hypothetical protein
LYLSAHSSHPPGQRAGIVLGQVFRFCHWCSNIDNVLQKH